MRLMTLTKVVNRKSLAVAGLATLSTFICLAFGIRANLPDTLIATAIIFPLVFSIGTAYTRREKALEEYGNLKAHGRALFLAARDWLPAERKERTAEVRNILRDLLTACRDMFTGPLSDVHTRELQVYDRFSRLSLMVKELREDGLASTECSRCNQYISRMLVAFENTRHIYEYRTPRTLRAFSDFFILLLSVLYGPYFAFQATEFDERLFFVLPTMFALILVGLSNIQDHLENPFDQIGDDDVAIDPERYVETLGSSRVQPVADPV